MNRSVAPSDAALATLRERVNLYLQRGMWQAAEPALAELLRYVPDDVDARLALSKVRLQAGQLRVATNLLLQIAEQPPDDASKLIELAQMLAGVGEIRAARRCLRMDSVLRTTSRVAIANVARVYYRLGESAVALTWMDRAMDQGDEHRENHHFHALLLQFVGRIDEAEAVLDACLRRWPDFGSAALTRSRLRRQTDATQHVPFLREQVEQCTSDDGQCAASHFALFKELDDLGRFAEAWPHLERANAIMHARNPYDEKGDAQLWEATQRYVDATICQHAADWEPSGPRPIFIVGMPRSGTTLLDRMLGGHSQVTSAGELSDFFNQWRWAATIGVPGVEGYLDAVRHCSDIDFRQLGERYLRQTTWRANGRAYFIDKMPGNFQFAGLIRRALPHALILHMVRDPMAVCFSNFKAMFGDMSAHSYDQELLARHYLAYERLHRHWQQVAPGAMLDVSYADLVNAPEATLRRVLAYCNLGFEAGCLDLATNEMPVASPSSAQVRQPLHQRAVDEWRHYEAQLRPMQQALDSRL